MGFLRNPRAFLRVLGTALEISGSRFILFSAGYEPLEAAIDSYAKEASSCPEQTQWSNEGVSLFGGRLFCFSGYVRYTGSTWILNNSNRGNIRSTIMLWSMFCT